MSFKQGQKIDVFIGEWRVGFIKKVYNVNASMKQSYLVGIDGLEMYSNLKKFDHHIAKLNTHTIRHLYQYHYKTKICRAIASKQCHQCHRNACIKCNICKFNTKYYCGECIDKVEYQRIFELIRTSLFDGYNIKNNKIITYIVTFSVGSTFDCCTNIDGDKCSNTVTFKNEFDFKYNRDINNQIIYKYLMDKDYYKSHQAAKNPLKFESRIKANGEIMRIFCSDCNNAMSKVCTPQTWSCTYWCGIRHKSKDICYNHPLCFSCNKFPIKRSQLWECADCKMHFCRSCKFEEDNYYGYSYRCKLCSMSNEYGKYKASICLNIGHFIGKDICTIIAKYCAQYAINPQTTVCCSINCDNTIIINSKTEFDRHTDSDGRKIYEYGMWFWRTKYVVDNVTYNIADIYKLYSLFDKHGRIFCADCTDNELKRCRVVSRCRNRDGTLGPGYNKYMCANKDTDGWCKLYLECGSGKVENISGLNGKLYPMKTCKYEEITLYDYGDDEHDCKLDDNKVTKILVCKDKSCSNSHGYRDDYYNDNKSIDYYYSDWDERWSERWHEGYHSITTKSYSISKAEYRFDNIYGDRRFMVKSNKEIKKTHKDRKSSLKRKNDKRSNHKIKRKFKKRYLLSLQF